MTQYQKNQAKKDVFESSAMIAGLAVATVAAPALAPFAIIMYLGCCFIICKNLGSLMKN